MKKIITKFIIFLLFVTFNLSHVFAEKSHDNIPREVLEKVEQKIKESEFKLPDIEAWEVDTNGNKIKVTPRIMQNKNSKEMITTLSVPNDGYLYVFERYDPNTVSKNWHFKSTGTIRVANYSTSISLTAQYTQQNYVKIDWNVTTNVSGETTIGNGFLAGVKAKVGVEVARYKEWYQGQTLSTTITVPPRTIAYLTNYQVGVNSTGILYWRKYTPSGTTWIGYYTESAGGTVIDTVDINVELTSQQPM